jgi:hypothetical protein
MGVQRLAAGQYTLAAISHEIFDQESSATHQQRLSRMGLDAWNQ